MGENASEKHACFFSVRSLYTLSASEQKGPFISNCRVDTDFLKAIDWKWHSWRAGKEPWMETVDSHFHRYPAVSSIAAWPWRGREGRPCIWCFSWSLRDSAVTPIHVWGYSFERFHLRWATRKTTEFHCILSAHMLQLALIASTGIPHHLVSSPDHETIDIRLVTDKQPLSVVRVMQMSTQCISIWSIN